MNKNKVQKRYTLFGMGVLACNHTEALTKFRKKNFATIDSNESYMQELAERIKNFCNTDVDTSSSEAFVESLIRKGFIKVVEIH